MFFAALLATASVCTTFVPVSPRVVPGAPELEVQFGTPRRLDARTAAGEAIVRRDVTRGPPVIVVTLLAYLWSRTPCLN